MGTKKKKKPSTPSDEEVGVDIQFNFGQIGDLCEETLTALPPACPWPMLERHHFPVISLQLMSFVLAKFLCLSKVYVCIHLFSVAPLLSECTEILKR